MPRSTSYARRRVLLQTHPSPMATLRQASPGATMPMSTPDSSTTTTTDQSIPDPLPGPTQPTPSQQADQMRKLIPKTLTQKPRQPLSRPMCTHVSMVTVHDGSHKCHICGRVPHIGFIYACEQDSVQRTRQLLASVSGSSRRRLTKSRRRSNDYAALGLGKTVIDAINSGGHYTMEQIEILKAQKKHVQSVIRKATEGAQPPKARTGVPPQLLAEKLAALDTSKSDRVDLKQTVKAPTTDKGKGRVSQKGTKDRSKQACEFMVCHTCRPFSRDRAFLSIEQVLNGEVHLPKNWQPSTMPIGDVRLVRNLGLNAFSSTTSRTESSSSSFPLTPLPGALSSDDDSEGSERVKRLMERPSSVGFRASLRKALHDMLRQSQDSPTTFMLEKACVRDANSLSDEDLKNIESHCATEEGLDDTMWRVMSETLLVKAANTPLPGDDCWDDGMDLDNGDLSAGVDEVMTDVFEDPDNDLRPSIGLGLTLTEEAAENKSPDIIMAV